MENNTKWTIETYAAHNEARWRDAKVFWKERDRRYKEVDIEREKALKIKEIADNNALLLAREIQSYKDEKANELREQINNERLLYVKRTDIVSMQEKYDAIIQPLREFVASKGGVEKGMDKTMYYILTIIGLSIALLVAIFK